MGDKETRKRKKQRRESAKKDETDDSSPPREATQEQSNKKDSDHSSHSLNQPSLSAKLIFCILFILLISAVGLIFYTLNEATREPSYTVEVDIDEGHGREALPLADENHLEFGDTRDDAHSDVESEEHEGDIINTERTIEEILSGVEETITYNIDGQDTNNHETKLDSLNNEDANLEERSPQLDSISLLELSKPPTPSVEELNSLEDESQEEPVINNQVDSDLTREQLLVDLSSETISSFQQESLNELPQIHQSVEVPSFQEFDDFNEGENRVKKSDFSLESAKEKIQPSGVMPNSEESRNDESFEPKEASSINKEVEEAEPQPEVYENDDITNDYDFLFREELDEADKLIEKIMILVNSVKSEINCKFFAARRVLWIEKQNINIVLAINPNPTTQSLEYALKQFESLLEKNPKSPRVAYGKALVLDKLAETKKSNVMLENSIEFYKKTMSQPYIPQKLYLLAGNRAVDRLRFRGMVGKALTLQSEMADKFPNDISTQNQLAVSFMWMGENNEAKKILREVLKKDPTSGFAKVHLGFLLKINDQNYKEAIQLLTEGIATEEEGVIDGRFFFHLGDALHRSGFREKAMRVYEDGVKKGVFLSAMQRSLYNVNGLTGKPWWKPCETPYFKDIRILEKNWVTIRNEALSLLSDTLKGFEPEGEGLKDTGDWQQFNLFLRGQKVMPNCHRAPQTCRLIENIPKAAKCKRGQVKFSIMQPGTHVFAHTGPTNCRLRAHLGLVVPKGPRIRVGNDTKEWTEGAVIIFDDSFEHEVWHDGDSQRIVLIVDFWHPELKENVIKTLTPI